MASLRLLERNESRRGVGQGMGQGVAAAVIAVAGLASGARAQTDITFIPQLAGGVAGNEAYAVSGNGRFVVGASDSSRAPASTITDAFRFDAQSFSVSPFDVLYPSVPNAKAFATNCDGNFSAGYTTFLVASPNTTRQRAVRWTGTSVQNLGILGESTLNAGTSFAYGISGNGQVVVGGSTTNSSVTQRPFRWNGAMSEIPLIGGVGGTGVARAANGDGSVVVGESDSPQGRQAFRWTQASGTVGLGQLNTAQPDSGARAVTPDGSVVVGYASSNKAAFVGTVSPNNSPRPEGFRWTQATGMRALGSLPAPASVGQSSEINGVSADGLVLVGSAVTNATTFFGFTFAESEAVVWTPRSGFRTLKSILIAENPSLGPALADWRLDSAQSVSADGGVVTGIAIGIGATNTDVSAAFRAVIRPYCPGDFDGNGVVEVPDIFGFLSAFFAQSQGGDQNADGVIDVPDIFFFLSGYFRGCPTGPVACP